MKLGLDCSTKTSGWAISCDKKIKDAGFIDISKVKSNKDKVFLIVNFLKSHPLISEITEINLEAALNYFLFGFTSQKTIIVLSRFNAVLEYVLSEQFRLPVNLVNVNSARKRLFGKASQKGVKSKDFVKKELPIIVSDLNRFMKINKAGNPDKRNGDVRDAIVCSLF
jgi:hypothetical protein